MARTIGGHIAGPTLAAAPVSTWTDPAAGNLVTWETTGPTHVREAVANDVPLGKVIAVNPAATVVTVELFTGGMVAVLPYDGVVAIADPVEAAGTVNDDEEGEVRTDALNGTGRIIAVDRAPGYVDVYYG